MMILSNLLFFEEESDAINLGSKDWVFMFVFFKNSQCRLLDHL